MRTRRAKIFVLAAAVLCAAARVPAQETPSGTMPVRPPVSTGAVTFSAPAAQKLHDQFVAHEENVLQHLTGRRTLTFAELRKRQVELTQGLDQAANLPVEERDVLTAQLQKIGRLLFVSEPLARGQSKLDPHLEQVLRETADASPNAPADALMQVTGQLLQAASNPAAAAAVFDNLTRRLGGEPGAKTNLDAVRADFGAKTPLTFTPADDPRTLAGIMSVRQTPPVPTAPVRPATRPAVAPTGGTAAAALLAAYKPFRLELPDGAEVQFADERRKELGDIRKLAEAAERSFGGDPSTMGFDALIDRLIAREGRVARNVGVGGDITDFSAIPARLAAVRKVNPELASFMAGVWLYRRFLRQEMVDNHVALGTTFKPWETFPDGQGTQGSTLEGYERDGAHFVGLNYHYPDGSTRFQGAAKENHQGLVILSSGTMKTITSVNFDGEGKVAKAISDLYVSGVLTRKEVVDAGKGLSEIHTFKDGKEIKVATMNADGRQRIQDLLHDLDTNISKDGKVEIHGKPAPPGTPPVPILQVGEIDAQGNFILQKMVMQDGQQILTKSPHVTQMLDAANKVQGWNVEIGELVAADDASRAAKAHDYAAEIVKALFGAPDADKAKVLEGFLLDYAKSGPEILLDAHGKPSVRLFINERKTLMLIFGKKDGTRRIVSGVFKGGPEFQGHVQGATAFGVMGEILSGADGKIRQDDPTIQYEYIFDGSRLHWAPPSVETIKAPMYKFWQDDKQVTHFFIQRELRSGSGWRGTGRPWESEKYKLEKDVDGTSLTGSLARGISNTPILGQTLNFVGDGLGTIYKGAHYAVDSGIVGVMDLAGADESSIDRMRVERDANLANNPLSKLIVGGIEPDPVKDPEGWRAYHQRLVDAYGNDGTPGQRAILDERAKKDREKNLNAKGWTSDRAPEAFATGMAANVSADERYGANAHFGAGSYGEQLADAGHPYWGMLVQGTEVIVESLPAGFALGLIGKGAEGMQFLAKVMPKMSGVFKVGELGLRGLDYVLKPAIISQVALMGADHIGKAFQYRDDPTKFALNAGSALGDIAFGGMMLKGWLGGRKGGVDEMKADVDKALEVKVPPPAAEPVMRAENVAAVDVKPITLDAAVPPAGLNGEVKIPAVDGSVKIPAGENTRVPTGDEIPASQRAPPVETTGRPTADEVARSDYNRIKNAGNATVDFVKGITSSLSAKLNGLLGRASVESEKLATPKSEATVDDLKPQSHATGSENVRTGEDLASRTRVPEGDGRTKVPEGQVRNPVVDASVKGPEVDGAPKPVLNEASAERISPESHGDRLPSESERGLELRNGDKVPTVEEKVPEKTADKTGDKTGDKTPDKMVDKTADKTADKTGDKTADKTNPDEKVREPRTDRLGRWSDKLEGKTTKLGRFVVLGAHPLPVTPPGPRRAPGEKEVVKVEDGDGPVKPVAEDGGGPGPIVDDGGGQPPGSSGGGGGDPPDKHPVIPPDPTKKPTTPPTTRPSTSPTSSTAGPGPGGSSGGDSGGGSDKHPKVSMPGGGGGGGGGGGAGGGSGGGGGGGGGGSSADNSTPKSGAASAPAGDIGTGAPSGARPAPFVPPSLSGGHSGATANAGGLNGGHSPAPSLAARFDGSRERPRRAASGTPDTMKGLGAGDAGGLPHLTARAPATTAPATAADAALTDKAAASAAAPVAGAAAPGADVRPEAEDYNYTYLSPARHKYELPTDRDQNSRDWRYLMELGLQGSAALAAVYLIYHSDLGYLLGMARRRKKADEDQIV